VVPERPSGDPGPVTEPPLGLSWRHELELQVDGGIPGAALQLGRVHEPQQVGAKRERGGDRQDR
jgi:hypothetical protein